MAASILRTGVPMIVAVLAIAVSTARAAAPGWLKIDAGDFLVYTDSPEKVAMKSAVRFAAYRAAFKQLLLRADEDPPPSVLFIFRNKSTLREFAPPRSKDGNTDMLNYSIEVDGTEINAFSSSFNADEALRSTMEFETIWMMPRVGYHAPIWATQGTGKVLATTVFKGGRWIVGSELDPSFTFAWKNLFLIGSDSEAYRGTENRFYHNQIWALMHWVLLKDGDSRGRFVRITQELQGNMAEDVLPGIMDTPLDGFRKAIGQHFKSSRAREVAFDESAFRTRVKVAPAPRAEILVWTAELLGSIDQQPRATENLEEALELSPGLALVQEGWARKLAREGRDSESVIAYRKAIAAGSRDFVAYFSSGFAWLMEAHVTATGSRNMAGSGGTEARKAADHLRQAVLLNRGSQDSLREFGRAVYYSAELRDSDVALLRERVPPGQIGAMARIQLAMVESRIDLENGKAILRGIIDDANIASLAKSDARACLEYLSQTGR